MKFGVATFPTAYSMPMAQLAPALETRGFESLWVAEHSHIPASRETAWPGGAELPQHYYDTLDPFVALTAAACATTSLKIATGIALVIQRDAIDLAKSSASLDVVSNGRFMLGVGGGWNLEEMRDHGTEPGTRFLRLRESVSAIKALWTQEIAEYHGKLIDFGPTYQNPKPVQRPHPPVHVGGGFPNGLKRAVRYGNGWMPIWGRDTDALESQMQAVNDACSEQKIDRSQFEVTIYQAPADAEKLKWLASLGIDRAVFGLPSQTAEQLSPMLDEWQPLLAI